MGGKETVTFFLEGACFMLRRWLLIGLLLAIVLVFIPGLRTAEPSAVERGRKALLGRAFNPAIWSPEAYSNAWRTWGKQAKQPPRDYSHALRERYGLHPAPYANRKYPMGLREAKGLLRDGITTDCLICHGGSIAGKSYVGLGNASLDIQALFEDLAHADGRGFKTPFTFCNVRGTSEAASMAVFLLSLRTPDLRMRTSPVDLGLKDDMCEDVPAWWLLKKKKTMYYTGTSHARSVRSLMQFMLASLNTPTKIKKAEPAFKDIQTYLLRLEPPKYPFPIDRSLARKGERVFAKTCARCHGTYGEKWTYPNKIIPIDVIGTDRKRFDGLSQKFGEYYNKSWFGREELGLQADSHLVTLPKGYQAPPLDGLWATAPYLHNGSVPTVYHVLNSKDRPQIYTRSFRTGKEDFDQVKLGWRIRVLNRPADPNLPAIERRKIYDTTLPGRGNGGHTFGDRLTEAQRMAVIEYLKTL
jgi:mono/diheme cytochrome c family protein